MYITLITFGVEIRVYIFQYGKIFILFRFVWQCTAKFMSLKCVKNAPWCVSVVRVMNNYLKKKKDLKYFKNVFN